MMTNTTSQVIATNVTRFMITVMDAPTANVNLRARSRSIILKSEDT